MLANAAIRPGLIASIAALLGVTSASACGVGGREQGNFDDDIGGSEGAPPDLPALECVPRSLGLGDTCGPGEKCSYVVDPELGPTGRCVALLGESVAGDPCTRSGESDTCEAGSQCWAIDPQNQIGVCTDYCTAFLTCEDEAKVCLVGEAGVLALCLDPCLPTEPDACPLGWGCYDSPSGRWGCDRDYSGASGAHGTACDCVNCCNPGLVCMAAALVDSPACMQAGASGCCAEVCEVPLDDQSEPPICPSENELCRSYYDQQSLAGYEQVGVCRL